LEKGDLQVGDTGKRCLQQHKLVVAGRLPSQKLANLPPVAYEEAPEPKKAPKGSPKKAHKARQSQENGAGGRASKEQANVSLSTNAPATGTVVKMGRREGWARFLAYEVDAHHSAPALSHTSDIPSRPASIC
jgi:hypothetical protein